MTEREPGPVPPSPTPRLEAAALLPQAYEELRRLAAHYLRSERRDHTLQPTALVHEAFLKLQAQRALEIHDRPHFVALAAGAMRQILVDHARAHRALKRGGDWEKLTLPDALALEGHAVDDLLALDDALTRLGTADARAARIVELLYFGGLTQVEVGELLGMSERNVRLQLAHARAWLRREMLAGGSEGAALS